MYRKKTLAEPREEVKKKKVKEDEKKEEKKERGRYYIVIPLSGREMRIKEVFSPHEVDSYVRRNLIYNYRVFQGKDVTRKFRSFIGR